MIKTSIIINCQNNEHQVARAINSCVNQSLPHGAYEVIIVDDGSKDNSRNSILAYKGFIGSNFIRTKFFKKELGFAKTMNAGLAMAKGKYVVRIDGSDYIGKSFIENMSQVLDWNEDVGFVYCDFFSVVGTGAPHQRKFQTNTFEHLLQNGVAVMFRRGSLKSLSGYNQKLRYFANYDLLRRISAKYKGYHLRLPLYRLAKRTSKASPSKDALKEKTFIDELLTDAKEIVS